jgi:hypothetical protein
MVKVSKRLSDEKKLSTIVLSQNCYFVLLQHKSQSPPSYFQFPITKTSSRLSLTRTFNMSHNWCQIDKQAIKRTSLILGTLCYDAKRSKSHSCYSFRETVMLSKLSTVLKIKEWLSLWGIMKKSFIGWKC